MQTGCITRKVRQPPGPLGEHGSRLRASIISLYDLSPGEHQLLWQAAQTADLVAALDEVLWSAGATVRGLQAR
jgi:hypothetical protein